jgi:hypothetical protein
MDDQKELREIERRYEEGLLATQTSPGVGRYLFLPCGIGLAGLAGWLAGHDVGRIELWAPGLVGLFLFSVFLHRGMRWIGRTWIAYKYRAYDEAADETAIAALRATHERIELAAQLAVICATVAGLAIGIWQDLLTPLIHQFSRGF